MGKPDSLNTGMNPRDENKLMLAVLASKHSRPEAVYRYCLTHRINDWPYAEKLILEDLSAALAYHQHLKTGYWQELEDLITRTCVMYDAGLSAI